MAIPARRASALALLAALTAAPAAGAAPPGHGPDPASTGRLPEVAGVGLPAAWCGEVSAADDRAHEVDNGTHKYHAVYAVPSDGLDRFAALAATLQADALQASALIERLYGRAIRFDMGTSCGAQFLDISSVRLASSTAELLAAAGSTTETIFDRVAADLRAAGFPVVANRETASRAAAFTRNTLVWLDGPAPAGACGEAHVYDDPTRAEDNWNNYAGKVALMYRDGGDFCNSNTVRHEIGHNLGALQPGAPSAFDGAHCDDAYEDTMCYPIAPRRATGEHNALFFDYGNDDYWDPPGAPLPGWTVNLSRFLCPTADCNLPGGAPAGEPPAPGGDLLPDEPGIVAPDEDSDILPDAVDPCPATPGQRCGESADVTEPEPSVARARVRTRRVGPRRWRVRVRVSGRGRARVVLRCGGRAARRRVVRVPRSVKFKVRCRNRPRATVRALAPDEGR